MQFQPDYSLFQRSYTVLSGLRPPFTATSALLGSAKGSRDRERHLETNHETSASEIPAIRRGRCSRSCIPARRNGADLSVAAGALDRLLSCRRRERHHRTPDWSMAVGTPRTTIHH